MTPEDLQRELVKARDALAWCERHLSATSVANAALHTNETVYQSPLATVTHAARESLDRVLGQLPQPDTQTPPSRDRDMERLGAILLDLDRCPHGRHTADPCADCGGKSRGNPQLRPGEVIGYTVHAEPIVIPEPANRHNPKAWKVTRDA